MNWSQTPCTAFEGHRCIATGALHEVAETAKAAADRWNDSPSPLPVLVFNDATSEVIELDWRGTLPEFQTRFAQRAQACDAALAPQPPLEDAETMPPESPDMARGRGRPKLGVVAREVTLLPRHWEWLGSQSGGASVALRKLVDAARRASENTDRMRQAGAAGYRFMSTMAGHEPGFEEASRALFAGDQAGFAARIAAWPVDVQAHLKKILAHAFPVAEQDICVGQDPAAPAPVTPGR